MSIQSSIPIQTTERWTIGQRFVDAYAFAGYRVSPPAPLLDPLVPMAYVMSAGLGQIEDVAETKNLLAGNKFVLEQRCFRHFDMDKVGRSPSHLSLFHMAGAFHFGAISAIEPITMMWHFLTRNLELDPRKISVTYFAADEALSKAFLFETSADSIFYELGVSTEQVFVGNQSSNFWVQSKNVSRIAQSLPKCGTTTEFFYDLTSTSCNSACRPGCQCGRYLELGSILDIRWSLDDQTASLIPLRVPFYESVIGVERTAMAVEGVSSVFDLPLFSSYLTNLQQVYPSERTFHSILPVRSDWVIVDHLRALYYLISDGAPAPNKGGRAGIVRKIIRSILTHHKILGEVDSNSIPEMVHLVLSTDRKRDSVYQRLVEYIQVEGKRFESTLASGIRHLDRLLKKSERKELSGTSVLVLEKQYGFPLPLLELELAKRNATFEISGYVEEYEAWKRTNSTT